MCVKHTQINTNVFILWLKLFVATGTDMAGEVVEVGPGVKNFRTGDKVVAILNPTVSAHSFFFFGVFSSNFFLFNIVYV